MIKLGVDEDVPDDAKTASERDSRCPRCGAALESTNEVNVLTCPRCGTRPFERDHASRDVPRR